MIVFDDVTITYPGAASPALAHVNLRIPEGELVLVVGRTGSGKTTLLRAINGLVPHFTGGTLSGRVVVDGRDTAHHPPRELADLVGVVPQDPMSGFVTDTVEDELAYGMECLGIAPDVMRRRVEETLDLLGLADIRQRPLRSLSGGQRQRVAIGAVLAAHPRVLVLDEPTSALDPGAAEEVLAALQRLVHDLGVTVVMAEHRLERVVQYADQIVIVPGGDLPVRSGSPAEVMRSAPIAPPVVELGRLAGWQPLPLSVRDARRAAGPLRDLLVGRTPHLRPVREHARALAHGRGPRGAVRRARRPEQGVARGDRGRDRRPDGPQRCRQVDPAQCDGRRGAEGDRTGSRGRARSGRARPEPTSSSPWASCRRSPVTCSSPPRSPTSAGRRTATPAAIRAPRAPCSR